MHHLPHHWWRHADTVIVTGISAFAIAQRVLGASHFAGVYDHTPAPVLADKRDCLPSTFETHSTNYLLRTQLGCALTSDVPSELCPYAVHVAVHVRKQMREAFD